MAASSGWCDLLRNHKIFKILRENKNKNCDKSATNDAKNLIAIKDGAIFVWDAYNACLLTTNLKNYLKNSDCNRSVENIDYQELRCHNIPSFRVDSISCNQLGTYIALIGQNGLAVLELPVHTSRHGVYEDGKKIIVCRTVVIDERYFVSSGERLLDCKWHPGSANGSSLVLLTSDNIVRVYNLNNPQNAEQKIILSDSSPSSPSTTLPTKYVLGELAVSFDFGDPIAAEQRADSSFQSNRTGSAMDSQSFVWPLYLLLGNGEVYRLLLSVGGRKTILHPLAGPLRMYPAAEDNYGVDACSILYLPTRPSVLVISTCEGKLHNCILLNQDSKEDQQLTLDGSDASFTSNPYPLPSLFVYETIELELLLTTVSIETDKQIVDEFSSLIKLHRDPVAIERYHCSHGAGLHSVMLPWLSKFQQYCESENTDELPLLNQEQQSIVEHLVCTKPLPSSPISPIMGFAAVSDRLLGPKILCLTTDFECIALPLLRGFKSHLIPLSSEFPSSMSSSIQTIYKEPFDQVIQRILQRSSSNPRIKGSITSANTPQECFQLLSRATQIFREEYIQKHDKARAEIENRVRLLKEQKSLIFSDLKDLQGTKADVSRIRERLLEKCQMAQANQDMLTERLEAIAVKMEMSIPVLSDAEYEMQKDLKKIENNVSQKQTRINQLKDKQNYQDSVTGLSSSESSRPANSVTPLKRPTPKAVELSSSESQRLKSVLKNEGDQISRLMKQINSLQITINS